jgi:SAM-dependent methyltransferase
MPHEMAMNRKTLDMLVERFRVRVAEINYFSAMEVGATAERLILRSQDGVLVNNDSSALPRGIGVPVVAQLDHLPFAAGRFDLIVGSFVFCSLHAPARAARELHRVMARDGRYLGLEHVRAKAAVPRAAQLCVAAVHRYCTGGCSPLRHPADYLVPAGFECASCELITDWIEPMIITEFVKREASLARSA